jgi:hypothetical protein
MGRAAYHCSERPLSELFFDMGHSAKFEEFFKGIPEVKDYLLRLQSIVGAGEVRGAALRGTLNLRWDGPNEAKAVRAKVQEMEFKLRQLGNQPLCSSAEGKARRICRTTEP